MEASRSQLTEAGSASSGLDEKSLTAQRGASAPQRFQSFLVVRGIPDQELERIDLIHELPFREQSAVVQLGVDVEPVEDRLQKLISYFLAIGREDPDYQRWKPGRRALVLNSTHRRWAYLQHAVWHLNLGPACFASPARGARIPRVDKESDVRRGGDAV